MVGSVAVVGMVWSKERIEDLSKSGGNPPGSEAQTHSLTLTLTTHVFDSKFGRVWRLVVFSKTGIFGEDTESRADFDFRNELWKKFCVGALVCCFDEKKLVWDGQKVKKNQRFSRELTS